MYGLYGDVDMRIQIQELETKRARACLILPVTHGYIAM